MSNASRRAKATLEGVTEGPWTIYESVDNQGDAAVRYETATRGAWPLFICPDCGVCGESSQADAEFIAAARTLVPELIAEVERLCVDRRLGGQANYLLARIVAAANLGAIDGDDGFIESYNLPVGPIHKAIPFLNEQGIVVTDDGQIKNGPENLP